MTNFEKVSLKKGEEFNFEKLPPSVKLDKMFFGLGWRPARVGQSVDLDASIVQLDEKGKILDFVFFGNKNSSDGSMSHSGDDLTGENSDDGDDEVINIDVKKLNPKTKSLVVTVTSYSGQTLNSVKNAYCRVCNVSTGEEQEIVRYNLKETGNCTAMIVAKLYLEDGDFKFMAVGNECDGKTVGDLKTLVKEV